MSTLQSICCFHTLMHKKLGANVLNFSPSGTSLENFMKTVHVWLKTKRKCKMLWKWEQCKNLTLGVQRPHELFQRFQYISGVWRTYFVSSFFSSCIRGVSLGHNCLVISAEDIFTVIDLSLKHYTPCYPQVLKHLLRVKNVFNWTKCQFNLWQLYLRLWKQLVSFAWTNTWSLNWLRIEKKGIWLMCHMYGCVYNLSLCLTKLSSFAAQHDTELSVAVCQLLLSYRDTQSYNNISRAQWGWLCRPGSRIVAACCRQHGQQPHTYKDLHKTLLQQGTDDTCHSHGLPTQDKNLPCTQAGDHVNTSLHVRKEAG